MDGAEQHAHVTGLRKGTCQQGGEVAAEPTTPRSFGEHQLLHDVRRQPERLALGRDGDVTRPRAADRDVEELALLQAVIERLPALQLSLVAMIRMRFVDGVVRRTGSS